MLKKVIIPVAAFAVTATTVSAFDLEALRTSDINLSDTQIAAFEKAEALKEEGASRDEVESVLAAAGIDADVLRDIHEESHAAREAAREAIDEALADNDYEAFKAAVADTPLADKIDSADAFAKLVEAHSYMEQARSIFDELGIEGMMGEGRGHKGHGGRMMRGEGGAETNAS